MTDDFKLVYSQTGRPWLFDLRTDPDELKNCFGDPARREIVKRLTRALVTYGKTYNDPYIENPKLKADMQAALGATEKRSSP